MMTNDVFVPIFKILWQQKKWIIGAVLATAIAVSAVMLMQPNYYRSVSTFYPVNNQLLDPSAQSHDHGMRYYGDDHDIDRLLSMAKSDRLISAVITDNNLAEHYEIDPQQPKAQLKLRKTFRKLFQIQKTQYDAIELSVEDQDPAVAQSIVSSAVRILNEQALDVVTAAQQRQLRLLESRNATNQEHLGSISDSLQYLRNRYGIYSAQEQAEAMTALEIKNPNNATLKKRIANYSAGLASVKNLESRQRVLNSRIAGDIDLIQQLKSTLGSQMTALHIIEPATMPLEKSWPRRSVYVLASCILAGGLASLFFLVRAQIQR